jgi:serum/glucocorticoid-regulated kinase 2
MSWNSLTAKLKNTRIDKDPAKTLPSASTTVLSQQQQQLQLQQSSHAQQPSQTIASSTIKPGLLTVSISEAKGLRLPPGCTAPNAPAVNRHARTDSMRPSRSNAWWLPYLLVECDKNEVLIDALATGSTLENSRWDYKTTLYVFFVGLHGC